MTARTEPPRGGTAPGRTATPSPPSESTGRGEGPSPAAATLAGEAPPRPALPRVRLLLAGASAALLFALMGATIVDVAGRYLLSRPLPGATEITELLLAATVFVGLAAVCLDDGHVTVDLLTSRLPPRLAAPRLLMARLVTAAALLLVGWRLAVHGERLASYGETSVYLRLPVAPVAYAAAALCVLAAALALLLAALRRPEGG